MKCNTSNLPCFVIGDDIFYDVVIQSSADGVLTPFDIQGDDFWMTVKASKEDDDPGLMQKHILIPGTDANGAIGRVQIPFTAAETGAVTEGTHYYDIQWVRTTSDPSKVITVSIGRVEALQQITTSVA